MIKVVQSLPALAHQPIAIAHPLFWPVRSYKIQNAIVIDVSKNHGQHDRVAYYHGPVRSTCGGPTAIRATTKAQGPEADFTEPAKDIILPFAGEAGTSSPF